MLCLRTKSQRILLRPALSSGLLLGALLGALLITGCVQSSQRSQATLPPVLATPVDTTPTQETNQIALTTTTTLPPEGLITDISIVEVGHCFNNYRLENERTGSSENIFTLVDCERPHEGEVYHQVIHPAATDAEYPGDRAMENWEQEECYKTFQDWVGQEFELSGLYFSSIRPDAQLWNDDPSARRLSCYLRSADGSPLSSSQRNANT